MNKTALSLLTALLTLAFLWFGGTKLFGSQSAVTLYDALGYGQGVRYVTGSVETLGAILLWVPGLQALAALALTVTMIVGLTAKAVIVGGAVWHLVLLLIGSAVALYGYRQQLLLLAGKA